MFSSWPVVLHSGFHPCLNTCQLPLEGPAGASVFARPRFVRLFSDVRDSSPRISILEHRAAICALSHLAWEQIHTGPWHEVPATWRRVFALSALLATILSQTETPGATTVPLKHLDTALMVSGTLLATPLHEAIALLSSSASEAPPAAPPSHNPWAVCTPGSAATRAGGLPPPPAAAADASARLPLQALGMIEGPGLLDFEERFFTPQRPGLFAGVIDAWPACSRCALPAKPLRARPPCVLFAPRTSFSALSSGSTKGQTAERPGQFAHLHRLPNFTARRWKDVEYLPKLLGQRTVPVEVGEHYLHPSWSQQLLPFHAFWAAALRHTHSTAGTGAGESPASATPRCSRSTASHGVRELPACASSAGSEVPGRLCAKRRYGDGPNGDARHSKAARDGHAAVGAQEGAPRGLGSEPAAQHGEGASRCFGSEDSAGAQEGAAAGAQTGAAAGLQEEAAAGLQEGAADRAAGVAAGAVQYLAQHELFQQVPALQRDIMVCPAACLPLSLGCPAALRFEQA